MNILLNSGRGTTFSRELDDPAEGQVYNVGTWNRSHTAIVEPDGGGSVAEFRYHRSVLTSHPLAGEDITVVMGRDGRYFLLYDKGAPLDPQPVHSTEEWREHVPDDFFVKHHPYLRGAILLYYEARSGFEEIKYGGSLPARYPLHIQGPATPQAGDALFTHYPNEVDSALEPLGLKLGRQPLLPHEYVVVETGLPGRAG